MLQTEKSPQGECFLTDLEKGPSSASISQH